MDELKVAVNAVKEAGRIILKNYGSVSVSYKKDKSFVTEADLAAERRIKEILNSESDYAVLGEESGLQGEESEYVWIVDPLDGTTNFTVKNPFFAVSVGLVRKGEPVLGVVYNPLSGELFHAKEGEGAHLNGERVRVSDKADIKKAVVAFCHSPEKEAVESISRIFRNFKLRGIHFRQIGAASLEMCFVACGRIEAFMMVGVNPWDVAAGTIIIREAGGIVTDLHNERFTTDSNTLLASNSLLHGALREIIREEQ